MTFSVVIPAFNGDRFIEVTILSVLGQTLKPDEIIVHDDNSTDSTPRICAKYRSDIRYYLNSNGPSGFVDGWNRAVAHCKSDYIVLLHQDDLLYPTFLQEVKNAVEKFPETKHLFTLCDYISDTGKVIASSEEALHDFYNIGQTYLFSGLDYVRAYQKSYSGIVHIHRCPGVVTHRSVFDSGYYYNPDAGHIADDDFFYRVSELTPVVGVMKALAAFRIHNTSETGRIGDIELARRLSKDYLFQVRQWKDSKYIGDDCFNYFVYNAFKYSNRLFGYGVKRLNVNLILESIKTISQLHNEGFKNPRILLRYF